MSYADALLFIKLMFLQRGVAATATLKANRSFHGRTTPPSPPGLGGKRQQQQRWQQLQRRRLGFASFIPKTAIQMIRVPIVAATGAGMGLSAYIHYQIEDATKWYNVQLKKTKQTWGEVVAYLSSSSSSIFSSSSSSSAELKEEVEEKVSDEQKEKKKTPPPLKRRKEVAPILQEIEEDNTKNLMLAQDSNINNENHLVGLTKTLIEIRNLLKKINGGDGSPSSSVNSLLILPSIVVVGSQSSGKSSVLEAIVGHEFLPKGSNMVTRRPIELTLVHTPDSAVEYSEFPQLKIGKIKSFEKVQKTLTDLNLAVSEEECVSSSPIELIIHSPHVPDLTLVDLPGYIQVTNKNQPRLLQQKISELCERYIQSPNIILAVSAADVDLANSEALRASRRVDPDGKRTIGVVTKMDLIDAEVGSRLLKSNDYPLALGYIGVVNQKANSGGGLSLTTRGEDAFFKTNPEYEPTMVGSGTLRKRLMNVLETTMSSSLVNIVRSVQSELDDARYQFKVQYNDRTISPESYVAECMDALKGRFKEFSSQFEKSKVKESILRLLQHRSALVLEDKYWSAEMLDLLADMRVTPGLDTKLSQASAGLTRSGVGKYSVDLVVDMISAKLQEITLIEPWSHHENARKQVLDFANTLLKSKYLSTIDQVENTIKPYKFDVDISESEWVEGQHRATEFLRQEIYATDRKIKPRVRSTRRKLKHVISYLNYIDAHPEAVDSASMPPSEFSAKDLQEGREELKLHNAVDIMNQRLAITRSRSCSSLDSKSLCPEVFLSVVSEKLAATAVMFIYIELLNEFFFQLPRQVDNKMYYSLGRQEMIAFSKENPSIRQHLILQERKETLELVVEKLQKISSSNK